jgi:hypothetical protein
MGVCSESVGQKTKSQRHVPMLFDDTDKEAAKALRKSIVAQAQRSLAAVKPNFDSLTGAGVLFVSHDLRVVRHIAHRIAIMYLGRVVELCPANSGRCPEFTRPMTVIWQPVIFSIEGVGLLQARLHRFPRGSCCMR